MLFIADPGDSEQEIASLFYHEDDFVTDDESAKMYAFLHIKYSIA